MDDTTNWLLRTPTKEKWQRIGAKKSAGVVVPLFSIFSAKSIGIGEFPDLKLVVDWCNKTGMRIIQLLPLNDVGFNFTPYDGQSMFALDPMYLSLTELEGINVNDFKSQLDELKQAFPSAQRRINYGIKVKKLDLLWKLYQSRTSQKNDYFESYKQNNKFWLNDYALYKILKDNFEQHSWLDWPEAFRHKLTDDVKSVQQEKSDLINFYQWLQWQASEQMKSVKAYANQHQVYLMGDLPFLVSQDSADVWGNQDYFKLGYAAGAPPDMYFAQGQRWGMPPYNWPVIEANHYDYLSEKLHYAECFYDLYRIDHFVGIFRLWTIPHDDSDLGGQGFFDPQDETLWEAHGKKILDVMVKSNAMLPCAEDLGTVPDCSYKVIKEYGVVGTDIQRWMKRWESDRCEFKPINEYRENGIAAIATHDLTVMHDWWENEVGTVDEGVFRKKCEDRGFDSDWLIGQLFYQPASDQGRLRWRQEIDSMDKLLSILYRHPDEVSDFIDLFKCSRFEKEQFLKLLSLDKRQHDRFSPALAKKILETINESNSIFSIQLLGDWLSISTLMKPVAPVDQRINVPGMVSPNNWSLVMPFSLETLNNDSSCSDLYQLNKTTGRI